MLPCVDQKSKLGIRAKFREDLEWLLQEIHRGEKIMTRGDLNIHVSRELSGYRNVHGGYGFREQNNGVEKLFWVFPWDMILSWLILCSSWPDERLVTYENGSSTM